MKKRGLALSVGSVLAMASINPAMAVMPVLDAANLAVNTTNSVANVATSLKMHLLLDRLNHMGDGDVIYHIKNEEYNNKFIEHNEDVTNHNEYIANIYNENNYYCNIGAGTGAEAMAGDQICSGNGDPGEIVIPIPVAYGVGKFGEHDSADQYMDETRQVLADLADYDEKRFTSVMDSNAVQAKAVDQQARAFADDSNRLKALTEASTANMGSRMQAVFSNQIAAAQTAEMMQMRALMLADQNAQVVRAQEVASRSAREAVAERRLRMAPDLSTEAIGRW